MQYNSTMLLKKGTRYHKIGKILSCVLLVALGIFILDVLIFFMDYGFRMEYLTTFLLVFNTDIEFIDFLTALFYVGFIVGMPGPMLYFGGLHIIGLGQIAENTSKE